MIGLQNLTNTIRNSGDFTAEVIVPLDITAEPTAVDAVGVEGVDYTTGVIDTTTTGGVGPFTYLWTTDGDNVTPISPTEEDSAFTVTEASTTTPPTDSIAFWEFDETTGTTISDTRGSFSASLSSGSLLGGGVDSSSGGLYMKGGNYASTTRNSTWNDLTDVSVSCWCRSTELTGTGSTGELWYNYEAGASQEGEHLYIDKTTGRAVWAVSFNNGIDPQQDSSTAGSEDLLDGLWHHVLGTYNDTTGLLSLYVDGELVDTQSGGKISHNGISNAVGIGGRQQGGNKTFTGNMDNLEVWDRVLTATEVANVYGSVIPSAAPIDFVAEWSMDATSGSYTILETTGDHEATAVVTIATGTGNDGDSLVGTGTQYATVADHADLRPSEFTTVAWVKTTDTGPQYLASHWGLNASQYTGWFMRILDTSNIVRCLVANGTGLVSGTNYGVVDSVSTVTDGEWHSVILTYDGSDMVLYIDGVAEGTTAWAGGVVNTAAYDIFVIGSRSNDNGSVFLDPFDGELDGIKFFDRAITASEAELIHGVSTTTVAENVTCTVTDAGQSNLTDSVVIPFDVSFSDEYTASLSPSVITAIAGLGGYRTTQAAVGSVIGGAGPFTYAWTHVSGDNEFTINTPTSISTTFTGNDTDVTYTGTYRLTVTDTGNSDETTFVDIDVTIIFGSIN